MGNTRLPCGFALMLARLARLALLCTALVALLTLATSVADASVSVRHLKRAVHHRPRARHRAPAPAQCANANTSATSATVDAMRAAVVCLINQQRNKHRLPSLSASSQLDRSAQNWNNVMVSTGIFSHGPGDAFAARITATGYDWQSAGENIATGYLTPATVVSAWMASPDHCRNILDPSFRDVGTGEAPSGVSGEGSGPATWTQDFGLRMDQSAPSGNSGPQSGCPY